MDNPITLSRHSHGIDISYGRDSKACVLLARDVPGDFNQAIERAFPRNSENNVKAMFSRPTTRVSRGGPPDILDTFEAKRSESNIDRWSGNWLGYYCPLTPGGGLHFDTQSELTPQIAQHYWYDGGRSRDVDRPC